MQTLIKDVCLITLIGLAILIGTIGLFKILVEVIHHLQSLIDGLIHIKLRA